MLSVSVIRTIISQILHNNTERKVKINDERGQCLRSKFIVVLACVGDRGSSVVKVLCYKSEDRWFDPSWCH